MNLFFWRHKHSDAVIKHEDFEKLPDEHKKKFEKSNKHKDSTHHVINKGGDYSLYATMGLGSVGLGFVTGSALGAIALAESENSDAPSDFNVHQPSPEPQFDGGSGGGAGAGGSWESGDVQSPVVDITQPDPISIPDSSPSYDSSSNSDNSSSSSDNSSSSYDSGSTSMDSSSSFDSSNSSIDSGGGF